MASSGRGRLAANLLRITGLDQQMPVFTTIDDALGRLTARASTRAQ
jgi:hypothetical protein